MDRRAFLLAAAGLALSACGGRKPAQPTRRWEQRSTPDPASNRLVTPVDELPLQRNREPRITPRHAWTNRRVGNNADPMRGIRRITLHHTGEHLSSSGLSDREVIQRIERYHVEQLGWAAIGYHYLIGHDGAVFEGRPLDWQGAHCGGANNRHNIGVTVIGHFDQRLPDADQLATVQRTLDHLRSRHAIPLDECYGHRDWKATVCPGAALYAWLDGYRRGQRPRAV